jgi:hypothetical protein
MAAWLLLCGVVTVACAAVAAGLVRVRRELAPTLRAFELLGEQLRPAVVRLRDGTAAARDRLARHEAGR